MEKIGIKSKLYDYSVEFIDDFSATVKTFADTTVYVIDKNVYALYQEQFAELDAAKIYFMDAVEKKKNTRIRSEFFIRRNEYLLTPGLSILSPIWII